MIGFKELDELLVLLHKHRVHSFSSDEMTVTFRDDGNAWQYPSADGDDDMTVIDS